MSTIKTERKMDLVVGDETVSLSLPESAIEVGDWEVASDRDVANAVRRAFDHPIDFPTFSQAFVEGDRIALAVEPGLPRMMDLVEGAVQYLLENGAKADLLSVSLAEEDARLVTRLTARLAQIAKEPIDVRYHHSQDPDSMGYLAAAKGAEPIYIDRALLEADVVLPISCARDPKAWAYAGLYGIVPWFTDAQTQQRWRYDYATKGKHHQEKRLRAAKEVAWLLGIQPVMAVVPGPYGRIDSLFFGAVHALERSIDEAIAPRSITPSSETFQLVVCSIDGDQDQQSWDNVARILSMVEHFLQPSGIVALATRLTEKPSSVFRHLGRGGDAEKTERQMLQSGHAQALAAIEIFRCISKRSVFMMSRLPREQVEAIGIGAIADLHELEHLIASYRKTLVISGAQHRRVNV